MERRSKYDNVMADDLNITLSYYHTLVDRMEISDLQKIYFYLGSYHVDKNEETKKEIDIILKKYQRIDKLNNIINDIE